MCHVEENILSNLKQMALLIIREEMSERHLVGTDRDLIPTCKAFLMRCCCVVLGFVSRVLSVRNRCLLTALRKQT